MKIKEKFSNISVDVDFNTSLGVFYENAGTGKTLLFKTLRSYFVLKNVPVLMVDYNLAGMLTPAQISYCCEGKKIIMFDNSDLYLTEEILQVARKNADLVLIVMHTELDIDLSDATFYFCHYENGLITVEEE